MYVLQLRRIEALIGEYNDNEDVSGVISNDEI